MYIAQNTADIIKKLLIDKKITAKKMCIDCEIGVNTLSNIRRGDVKSIETFYIIADYLDCSVDYLLGRTDVPEVNKKTACVHHTDEQYSVPYIAAHDGKIKKGKKISLKTAKKLNNQ